MLLHTLANVLNPAIADVPSKVRTPVPAVVQVSITLSRKISAIYGLPSVICACVIVTVTPEVITFVFRMKSAAAVLTL